MWKRIILPLAVIVTIPWRVSSGEGRGQGYQSAR